MSLLKKSFDEKLIIALSVLISLIPFALLTGPFLPDLFLTFSVIIFLYFNLKKYESRYLKSKFFIFFLIFYIFLILSSSISKYPFFSLESSIVYIRFPLFALTVWFLLDINKNFKYIFTYFFLIAYIFALLDGFYQLNTGQSIFSNIQNQGLRLTLPFTDKAILGGYLARLLPMLFAVAISFMHGKQYIIYFLLSIIIIFTDILVFMTGERTALGLIFIYTVFLVLFIKKFKILRLATFIISIIIIFIITISNPVIKSRNIDKTMDQIGISTENQNIKNLNYLSEEHQDLFVTAFNIFVDNPLFGIGPNNFRNECSLYDRDYGCSTHPHNIYIQLLAETGSIGFIFILILCGYFILLFLRFIYFRYKQNIDNLSDYQLCMIACFLLTLWPILPTLNFFNNWINIIYFLPVGFYLHSRLNMNEINNY